MFGKEPKSFYGLSEGGVRKRVRQKTRLALTRRVVRTDVRREEDPEQSLRYTSLSGRDRWTRLGGGNVLSDRLRWG